MEVRWCQGIGKKLIQEITVVVDDELVHRKRSCTRCNKLIDLTAGEQRTRDKRRENGKSGNLSLCSACDDWSKPAV